jgi:integrase
MPLSNTRIVKLKPRDRAYKESDEKGLYLYITPSGGKLWRMKYRFGGKEKTLSFGKYPEITLKQARDKRDEARSTLANGVDPGELKKQQKRSLVGFSDSSFEAVTREWFSKFSVNWSPMYSGRLISKFEKNVFPWIGAMDCNDITPPTLLSVLRRIEHRGAVETAHRTKQSCGQVFRYAIATGRCERDPSADLKGALPPVKKTHFATITDAKGIGALLRVIDTYEGHHPTRCALKLAPLVFVRPGELRHAEWSEINFEESEWRIPAEKMKMNAVHIVPLSTQSIAVLQDIYPLTGKGKYIFPSIRSSQRAMSENTVNAALRRLGYDKTEMTGHGFRAMASTLLNEQGWNKDAIERQLAHAERDGVRASYNYAEYLPERKKMMQEWADYLDKLKTGAEIIPMNKTV